MDTLNTFIDLGKLTSLELAALASIINKAGSAWQRLHALENIALVADCLAGDEHAADVAEVDEFFGN
jgi:hypothetical protein